MSATVVKLSITGSWKSLGDDFYCHGTHKVHGPITVRTDELKRPGQSIYVRRMAGAWSYAAEPVS